MCGPGATFLLEYFQEVSFPLVIPPHTLTPHLKFKKVGVKVTVCGGIKWETNFTMKCNTETSSPTA